MISEIEQCVCVGNCIRSSIVGSLVEKFGFYLIGWGDGHRHTVLQAKLMTLPFSLML